MTKFEEILKLGQLTLKKRLRSEIGEIVGWSKNSKIADGFLYYAGKLPVLLVAHLDTVHKKPPKLLMYSEDGKIMNDFYGGIGGDDRYGVWMLLQILRKCKENPPHLLFCEDLPAGRRAKKSAELVLKNLLQVAITMPCFMVADPSAGAETPSLRSLFAIIIPLSNTIRQPGILYVPTVGFARHVVLSRILA